MLFEVPAQAACDPYDERIGWTCDSGSFFDARVVRMQVKMKHTKRVRRVKKAVRSGNHRLVRVTKRDVGRNPTGRRYLWCQDYVNLALRRAGYRGTGSRRALSSLKIGSRISNPKAGDIAVRKRGRYGGHSGIVVAVSRGKFLLRGGNQCGRRGRRVVCDRWVSTRRYRFRRI